MKAFFDRTAPYFIVEEASFDAVPVEVDPIVVENVRSLTRLYKDMEEKITNASAPEDSAQELCDFYASEVRKIFKSRKQDNSYDPNEYQARKAGNN